MHCAHLDEAREMVGNALQETSPGIRFAAPPWNDQSAPWRQIDAQLPQDHLAREIREAMIHLDLTALYASYAGRGKVPHRPDLMLAIVLFELRRGQRQPSQWFHDTHENCALWWLGYGIRPARSCWYEFRERTAALVDTRIPKGRPRRRCPRGWPRHPVAARRSASATCRHRHTSQGCRQPTNTIVPQSGGLLTSSWSAPATLQRRWAWTKITSFGPYTRSRRCGTWIPP